MKKAIVLATMLVLAFALALPAPCFGQPGLTNQTAIITGQGTLTDGENTYLFSISAARHDRGLQSITAPNIFGHLVIGDGIYLIRNAPIECDRDADGDDYFPATPVGSNPKAPSPGTIGVTVYYGVYPEAGLVITGGDTFYLTSGWISCRDIEN